jgi:hypothetical protein
MFSDRLLRYTLIFSVIAHGAILLSSHSFNPFTPAPKAQEIAVRYIKKNPAFKPLPKSSLEPSRQKLMPAQEPFLKLDAKTITMAQRAPIPYIEEAASGNPGVSADNAKSGALAAVSPARKPLGFSKPALVTEVMAIKKKITLPAMEMARSVIPAISVIIRLSGRRSAAAPTRITRTMRRGKCIFPLLFLMTVISRMYA